MIEIPVWADLETKSECDLKKHGTHRYAEHPSTKIQLFSYAVDDGPVKLWSPEDGESMPRDLQRLIEDPKYVFWFHNAWFDRNIIENVIGVHMPIKKFRCCMALALSHALPAGLEKLGEVMGLHPDLQKIKDGKRLVMKFCRPKKQKDGSLKWATPETDPEDWQKYKEYCSTDTASMRAAAKKIPRWNYTGGELDLWFMDQIINSRGMYIDLDFVNAAVEMITGSQKILAAKTHELTDGEVEKASQRDAMLQHIFKQYGYDLMDLRKSTVESLLENDDNLPPVMRELLKVRLDTSTSSTAKYKKIVNVTGADSRVRGTIQFAGASRTLRDGGRMVQPQNMPRPTIKHKSIESGIDILKNYEFEDAYEAFDLLGMNPMELCSSALRYTICAAPGKKLVIADLANIEGRVLAYLAGETWKLKAFKQYDTFLYDDNGVVLIDKKGEKLRAGPDMYKASYAKSFAVDAASVTKDQRQIGKTLELSMGYQGAVGAIVAFATSFGIDLHELAKKVIPTLDPALLEDAGSFYDWLERKTKKGALVGFGLGRETFSAIDCLKRLWRSGHPATVAFWKDTEDAVRNAVAIPKKRFYFGNGLYAVRSGKWVRIVLPSGHNLCYPMMQIDDKGKLRFKGVGQFTKKWEWVYTYGGKLVENMVQAFARDIFKYGQLAAERAGYPVILPVHDENVTECPDTDEYSAHELEAIMATNPPWAADMPLAAEGFESFRYRK